MAADDVPPLPACTQRAAGRGRRRRRQGGGLADKAARPRRTGFLCDDRASGEPGSTTIVSTSPPAPVTGDSSPAARAAPTSTGALRPLVPLSGTRVLGMRVLGMRGGHLPLDGGVMNHHHQSLQSIDIDTRLVTTGAVLTAAGAVVACTGMVIAAVAVFAAGRRMIRGMDVPPAQQAAMKWQQAKEASRAGIQAWQSASDTQNGSLAR